MWERSSLGRMVNFGRVHKTLRVTPAMEAGITDHVWTLEEIAALTDAKT
jgi:hypothetical protein